MSEPKGKKLKSALEIALERRTTDSTTQGETHMGKKEEHRDSGLESFLHLLDPDLALPQVAVEPQEIRLNLDEGEKKEISLRITNIGRGYLSGTVELTEKVPGVELSAHRFGLDSKGSSTGRKISLGLHVDTKMLLSDRDYLRSLVKNTNGAPERVNVKSVKTDFLSLVIITNGTPERLVVPVFFSAAEARSQAEEEIKKIKSLLRDIESYGVGNTPSYIKAKEALSHAEAFFEKASLFDYWDAIKETTVAKVMFGKVPSEYISKRKEEIANEERDIENKYADGKQTDTYLSYKEQAREINACIFMIVYPAVIVTSLLLASTGEMPWSYFFVIVAFPVVLFLTRSKILQQINEAKEKEKEKEKKELARQCQELERTIADLEAKLRQ